ncbi:MAG TPA: hypothetical protein VHU90_09510, partial [Galbitalea sp.]|nr:hypothetical protein [Galbitalea sp.]
AAHDPVSGGLELAQNRLARHHLAFSEDLVEQAIRHTVQVLRQSETIVPERAIELTIETVAIAATMRMHYNEPELRFDEIAEFVDIFRRFMNSWWHE